MARMLMVFTYARRAVDDFAVLAPLVANASDPRPPLRPLLVGVVRIDDVEAWRQFVITVVAQANEVGIAIQGGKWIVAVNGL